MPGQITVRLDEALAGQAREAADAAGTSLSEWVRAAIRHQAALATAMRARADEDAGPPLFSDEEERTIVIARQRRAAASFDSVSSNQRG